jgi:hypothetical protein
MGNPEIYKIATGAAKALSEFNVSAFNLVPPLEEKLLEITKPHDNPASWTHERLGKLFKDFEEGLDEEHEIGMRLVSFGNSNIYRILDIGYWGPDIIIFHCLTQDGYPADLIQNVSQLNVLLLALPKLEEQARRIGFTTSNEKGPDKE